MHKILLTTATTLTLSFCLIIGCTSKEESPSSEIQPLKSEATQLITTEDTAPVELAEITENQTYLIAGRNLESVRCNFKGIEFLSDDDFTQPLTIVEMGADGKLYIIDNEKYLRRLKVTGNASSCTLTLDTRFGNNGKLEFGQEIDELSIADNTIYASGSFFGGYQIKKGQIKAMQCLNSPDDLIVHSSGKFALTYSNGGGARIVRIVTPESEVEPPPIEDEQKGPLLSKITFNKSDCEREKWSDFEHPFSRIMTLAWLDRDHFAIGGILPDKSKIVAIFDRNGRERLRLGNTEQSLAEDGFGWVRSIEQCGQDYCVLDPNFRRLRIWDSQGNFEGSVELNKVFGLDYAPIEDFEISSQFAWFTTSQERPNTDIKEGYIYRVKGF